MRKFYILFMMLILISPLSCVKAQESEEDRLRVEATKAAILKATEEAGGITPENIAGIFSLVISPRTPGPSESVIVSVEGSGLDFYTANISWSVNGKRVKSGRGEKNFSLVTGPLGSRTTVEVRIETGTNIFDRSIIITPAEVDLLWQGETYVSPFYQGRALWSSQSRITFLAIPHGVGNISPANLIYRWSKNGTVLGNLSGTGKNSLTISDSILSIPQNIKVDVLSNQNTLLASASTFLAPISPQLSIYENNPLYGFMFHREIKETHRLENREITLAAFPFFFSAFDRADESVSYEWRTNAGDAGTGNAVTYRSPDDTDGSSAVRVRASNRDKIMQDSDENFLVQFGK